MKKLVFAALVAALSCALAAGAVGAKVITSESVSEDTLALYGADSTSVLRVEDAARMWLTFVVVKTPRDTTGTPYAQKLDSLEAITPIRLAVQVRERLTSYSATDSSSAVWQTYAIYSTPDSIVKDSTAYLKKRAQLYAAYSDTTFAAWVPKSYSAAANAAASAAVDTTSVGNIAPGNATIGSSELDVVIPTKSGVWANARTRRVDLFDRSGGLPFTAKDMDVRWRLLAGPAVVRLRVILHREVW